MAVTLQGTQIVFNDGSTQASGISNEFGGVGTYGMFICANTADVGIGGTVAGSSLRYGFSGNVNTTPGWSGGVSPNGLFGGRSRAPAGGYDGGGSSLSGTWRKMSAGGTFYSFPDGYGGTVYYWMVAFWVRIA